MVMNTVLESQYFIWSQDAWIPVPVSPGGGGLWLRVLTALAEVPSLIPEPALGSSQSLPATVATGRSDASGL